MKKSGIAIRALAAFCASFLLLIAVDCLIPMDEGKIYNSVIRLHILANSDSDEDQAVKLQIRDAVIARSGEWMTEQSGDALPLDEMEQIGEKIEEIARGILGDQGKNYGAQAVWGRESYPTREYDGISFPAGEYYSLRINLGEAEGENWWCVLFPPLCTNAARANKNLSEMGISGGGRKVYTQKRYTFRFKFLELFG